MEQRSRKILGCFWFSLEHLRIVPENMPKRRSAEQLRVSQGTLEVCSGRSARFKLKKRCGTAPKIPPVLLFGEVKMHTVSTNIDYFEKGCFRENVQVGFNLLRFSWFFRGGFRETMR